MTVSDFDPDFPAAAWPTTWLEVRRQRHWRFETRHRSKNGEIYPVELTANFVDHEGDRRAQQGGHSRGHGGHGPCSFPDVTVCSERLL